MRAAAPWPSQPQWRRDSWDGTATELVSWASRRDAGAGHPRQLLCRQTCSPRAPERHSRSLLPAPGGTGEGVAGIEDLCRQPCCRCWAVSRHHLGISRDAPARICCRHQLGERNDVHRPGQWGASAGGAGAGGGCGMSRGGGSQQAPAAPAKPCQCPRLVEHSPEAPGGRPHPHRHGASGGQRSSVPARGDTLGRLRAGTGGQPWAGPGPQGRSRSPGSCGASTVPPTLPVTPALPCPAGHHLGQPAKGHLALLRVAGMAGASWTQPQALPHPGRDPALPSATACSPAGRAGRRHRLPRQRRRRQGRCCRFSCRMRWHHALTALLQDPLAPTPLLAHGKLSFPNKS